MKTKRKEKLTPLPRRASKAPTSRQQGANKPAAEQAPDLSHIADGLLKPEVVPVSELAFMTGNAFTHPEKQVNELRASLKQFKQVEPLIVNRRFSPAEVIGGNGRLQGMLAEGWTHAAVVFVDLPRARANALSAVLNRSADGREVDNEALDKLLRDLDTGNDPTLDAMIADLAKEQGIVPGDAEAAEDPGPQIDRAAELQKKWGTERGQLWTIPSKAVPGKAHRLLCGDSTRTEDVVRVMGGEKAGLVVTSPPYNQGLDQFRASGMHKETKWADNAREGSYEDSRPEVEYQAEQVEAIKLWVRHLAPMASMFYNHKNRYRGKEVVSPWKWLAETGAKVRQEIIWKREGSVTQNARMFMPCDERVYWLYFGNDFYFDDSTEYKTWSSVWEINSHKDREVSLHGCAFPLELASRPIVACSKPSEIVLEPYTGSGTTIVAAEQTGRLCYGLEIEPRYVAVCLERLAGLGLDPRLA